MIGKDKHARLELTSGKQSGKVLSLKKNEYSLGTHKKCEIRLTGEYVSELHAVIRKNESGIWTLTNNSPNGTYVNQLQIDTVELDKVSAIQIGAENSFEFIPLFGKHVNGIDTSDNGAEREAKKPNKWIWIVGAVFMMYLPGFLYLKNLSEEISVVYVEPPVITLSDIERVSEESRVFLSGYTRSGRNSEFDSGGGDNVTGLYERFVLGAFQDEAEKSEIIELLVEQSKAHLTTAHHYVQMNLDEKAKQSFRSAMTVFPDHRNPTSALASNGISALQRIETD